MMSKDLFYAVFDDSHSNRKFVQVKRVVHIFDRDGFLGKVCDMRGESEPGEYLMYCDTDRLENGDPAGLFFDSLEELRRYAVDAHGFVFKD